jgi:phosphatidylserine decarboxylase
LHFIYSNARENAPSFFSLLTSARFSSLLSFVNFDLSLGSKQDAAQKMVHHLGINLSECVESHHALDTPRKLFERKIKYWHFRPMPEDAAAVLSPADSKMLVGSLAQNSLLFLKEKFFLFEELLGVEKTNWLRAFAQGDFAIFRLTPEKYHYNHTPVTGKVLDIYEIPGTYHSCNPTAVVTVATPYSKNKRVVTIIDTDVEGGTQVGLLAMIEIVALMVGEIVQCYSDSKYDAPQPVDKGMFLLKGQPKSLYRPGSSVDVLIFQRGRLRFANDIVVNMHNHLAKSRLSKGFGRPLVETEVQVRSEIGRAIGGWRTEGR